IPAVDVEIGIEKERMPGRIVIEFETGQIDSVHRRDAHAFKVRTKSFDLGVVIGNLPIPRPAVGSTHATKDDEQGPARLARRFGGTAQVSVPAEELFLRVAGKGGEQDGQEGENRAGKAWRHSLETVAEFARIQTVWMSDRNSGEFRCQR